MKTAAEFVRDLPDAISSGDVVGGVYIDDIHARDIEVLEEAAKRVCPHYPPSSHRSSCNRCHSDPPHHACHGRIIHDLIAELKKGMADGT